nr:ethylene-responsive transcription factor 1B-like [Ipomoea batatas]
MDSWVSSFSPESSSWDFRSFDDSLPFNLNDSEEMLLFGVLEQAAAEENSDDTNSSDSRVRESLKEMRCQVEEGCSPVVALKRRHSMRKRRSSSAGRKSGKVVVGDVKVVENVVVFEDLGADYLEQLLSSSSEIMTPNHQW